jgi:hypothetical protein
MGRIATRLGVSKSFSLHHAERNTQEYEDTLPILPSD